MPIDEELKKMALYRQSARPANVPREEIHDEGQLIALFSWDDRWPLEDGTRMTIYKQCSALVVPARLVVEEDCARFFQIKRVLLGCESLLHAQDEGGCPASMFPALPMAQADIRAPWRNLARVLGNPGMQFAIEVVPLWNISPDSPPFRAAIYGRLVP